MGEAARIAERVYGAGAAVEQPAMEGARPDGACGLLAVEQLHRRAERRPGGVALFELAPAGGAVGGVDGARAHRLALDAVPVDQREHLAGRVGKRRDQAFALLPAERGLDPVGRQPEPGIDEADIAPGAAIADLLRLQHAAGDAPLREAQGGGEPGEACADDGDVRLGVAVERRAVRAGRRRPGPERVQPRQPTRPPGGPSGRRRRCGSATCGPGAAA